MILKNYSDLCRILGEDEKPRGTSRQNHLKWFEEYFTYKKEGHKFIITEIFDKEVEPIIDRRGGAYNTVEYTENIEKLLLDILAQDKNNGIIFLSKNKLFHMLEMVNVNYLDCNRRVPKLSKLLDIDENSVQEWYDTTGGMLERSLNSALKKLTNQSLILWSREITICKIEPIPDSEYLVKITRKDKYGEDKEQWIQEVATRKIIREATDDEKKYIIEVERDTMLVLDCDDKQEIIRKGLWSEFEKKVKSILEKQENIIYYYQSYKILFNPEHIFRKQNQINSLKMSNKERLDQKKIVNKSVMDRIENNAKSRHSKASADIEDIWNPEDDKHLRVIRRSSDKYIEDNIKLNKTLIDRNGKDIRVEVKKIKLE